MDEEKAKDMATQLLDKEVSGWKVGEYIGSGGTAFVCEASKGGNTRAIKIYDRDMVKKFGEEEIVERIKRQLTLVGKSHENLVGIYDGGFCNKTNRFYLVMENIKAKHLGEIIDKLPRERIGPLIGQVASAAHFLEEIQLVHRDIKPENIVVTDNFNKAVLLDFGVIRPVGEGDFTDLIDTTPFLGTSRYSSPEYLLRNEDDSVEGWRALTFYQLGGVLHDMIMRYPIFKDQTKPYARLVQAVQRETSTIDAKDVDLEIIHLAKKCLLKDPKHRIRCIQWDDFTFPRIKSDRIEHAKSRIKSRRQILGPRSTESVESQDEIQREVDQVLYDVKKFVAQKIRGICIMSDDFPVLTLDDLNAIEPSSFMLKVSYGPSEKHSLNKKLTVILNCNILDVTTQMIQLGCTAGLSGDYESSEPPAVMTDIFEGPFDKEIISVKINEMLHVILDKAQSTCESPKVAGDLGDEEGEIIWMTI